MKIVLQGEWNTGQVWKNGEPLKPVVQEGGFAWGSHSSGSVNLSIAVLMLFASRLKASRLCESFSLDVIARLPQTDFKVTLDVPAWIARRSRRRRARNAGRAR
ncbi:MAG: DUF6166 domain-containing protein [Syntrophobacteraceae bacterium]